MSDIFGTLLIVFFIFGILLFLGLRVLHKHKQTRTISQPPDITKNPERSWNQETLNLKADTPSAVPHPHPVSSGHVMTPTAVMDAKREVTLSSRVPQKNVLLWTGMETPITIHGYTIKNPFTYCSYGSVSPDEASCLDTTLALGQPYNTNTSPLPYWPRYSQINPDQRAKYITWLSTGKDEDLDEIGYAFLYFYGLERRALVDRKDIDLIVPEVRRLLERYRTSRSFNSYLGNFLGYIAALRLESLTEDNLRTYFPDMTKLTGLSTMVVLAWFAKNKKPLPWQLAYSVANHFSETALPSAVKKETSYLEELFHTRYLSTFNGGFCVVPAKNPYKLEYQPASPSHFTHHFNASYTTESALVPCRIPHPLKRRKQFNDLFSLWGSCVQDVRPFLTKLSKSGGTNTWQAYSCLPEELKARMSHPDQDAWDHLFRKHSQEKPWALAPVSSLAGVIGIEKRNRLTPVQSRNLSQTMYDAGYVLLPDIRHARNSYRWDEKLVLLPSPADDKEALKPSFPSYALILELGLGIAASDGHIDPNERAHLRTFFGEKFTLSSFEYQCLEALEDLYIQIPPSLTRLGKRLKEGLDPDTRLSVAQFLVGMAMADGTVDPKEKKNLGRIFKAMEIEEEYLHWILGRGDTVDPADAPVVVRSGTMSIRGETLPSPVVEVTPSFAIDQEAVARILDETRDVSEILGEVFAKEETDTGDFILEGDENLQDLKVQKTSPSDHDSIEYLQPRYVLILEELLTAEVWTRDEFVHLVQCHHCMPQATIEAINVWAEEKLGDFILEDNQDVVKVDQSLITSTEEDYHG